MGEDTGKKVEGINDPLTQTGTEAPHTEWGGDDESATDKDEDDDDDKEA